MEILKVKYSIDRKKKFQIKTVIYEENGVVTVKKEAYSENAISHIKSINKNYDLLQDSKMTLVEPTLENNSVRFPFVTGESIDSILIEYIQNKDLEGFKKTLTWYKSLLMQEQQVSFRETKQFVEVFGNIPSLEGIVSLKISNIDLNFDNLIIFDDKVTVIDYEWVFDFSVPLNYILYRAIFVFETKYHLYLKPLISIDDIFEYLKIPKKEIDIYNDMEISFISYVGRDISKYKKNYLKSNESLFEVTSKEQDKIIKDLNVKLEEFSTWGQRLSENLIKKDKQILKMNDEINEVSKNIQKQQKDLEEKDRLILEQNQKIQEVSLWGQTLYEQILEKDRVIEGLSKRTHLFGKKRE